VLGQGGQLGFGALRRAAHRLEALATRQLAQGGGGDHSGMGSELQAPLDLRLAGAIAGLADRPLVEAAGVVAPEAGAQLRLRAIGRQHRGELVGHGLAQGRLHHRQVIEGRGRGRRRHVLQRLRSGQGEGGELVAA